MQGLAAEKRIMDYKLACRQLMHALLDESLASGLCSIAQHYFDQTVGCWDETAHTDSLVWSARYGTLMASLDAQQDLFKLQPESETVRRFWRSLEPVVSYSPSLLD